MGERAEISDFRLSTFDSVIIQPGFVRSITTARVGLKDWPKACKIARACQDDCHGLVPYIFLTDLNQDPGGQLITDLDPT